MPSFDYSQFLTQAAGDARYLISGSAAGANGTMGYAQVVADQGTFTAETDLTSLTVTFTAATGRRYKITAGGGALKSSVPNDEVGLFIKEGAAYLAKQVQSITISNKNFPCHLEAVVTPTAGSHTYKLAASRNSGTGNVTFVAAAASNSGPAFILVEDIGT